MGQAKIVAAISELFSYDCFSPCDVFFSILSDWTDHIKIWKPGFIIQKFSFEYLSKTQK